MATIKLYHWTKRKHLNSILTKGLKVNQMGFLYLSDNKHLWKSHHKIDAVCIEATVNTYKFRLTCFEEERWGNQILCWSDIPKNKLKQIIV